jgi:hypothetical protein
MLKTKFTINFSYKQSNTMLLYNFYNILLTIWKNLLKNL